MRHPPITGAVELHAGAVIHGLVYGTAATWSDTAGAAIHGAVVLEGDLPFGELNLKAGDFHVATPSSSHPPGRTVNGCLVHVVMSLDQH